MTTDMTEGKIIPQLTAFTIPLVLGNLFQLTYNAADSVIVGKFVGDEALAAVGTAGPVMNMIILFISGMCMGAGILMSTQYGAKKYDQLERQISTTMLGGLVFSAVVALLLIVLAYPLLGLLQVPDDIVHPAAVYLRIIFVGLIFYLQLFFKYAPGSGGQQGAAVLPDHQRLPQYCAGSSFCGRDPVGRGGKRGGDHAERGPLLSVLSHLH